MRVIGNPTVGRTTIKVDEDEFLAGWWALIMTSPPHQLHHSAG
jgi:hypothetical protein